MTRMQNGNVALIAISSAVGHLKYDVFDPWKSCVLSLVGHAESTSVPGKHSPAALHVEPRDNQWQAT